MRRGAARLRETPEGPEKYCAYCASWWPLECFDEHPRGQGGLDNRCRACRSERRTSRTAGPIMVLLGCVLALLGCNGHSMNDREATWCVEAALYPAARAAADEWHERSDGEVAFVLEHLSGCRAPLRVVTRDRPGTQGAAWSFDNLAIFVDPVVRDGPEECRVALLHEWGHYLTGSAHSDDPSDVMYVRMGGAFHLSDADVARLDWPSRAVTEGYF